MRERLGLIVYIVAAANDNFLTARLRAYSTAEHAAREAERQNQKYAMPKFAVRMVELLDFYEGPG